MSRYIDPNTEFIVREAYGNSLFGSYRTTVAEYLGKYIDQIPTVDGVPVVHGEWIQMNGHRFCNLCGHKGSPILTNYCPNCGAKMDGETEYVSTYSLGKIPVPKGAIKQIIADGERKDGAEC